MINLSNEAGVLLKYYYVDYDYRLYTNSYLSDVANRTYTARGKGVICNPATGFS